MNIDILTSFCMILKYTYVRVSGQKLFHVQINKKTDKTRTKGKKNTKLQDTQTLANGNNRDDNEYETSQVAIEKPAHMQHFQGSDRTLQLMSQGKQDCHGSHGKAPIFYGVFEKACGLCKTYGMQK